MKVYLRAGLIALLLCLATGLVFAQDVTEQPSAVRPALVACVTGENIPCVQNVEQASDLVGTWRSYLHDSSGIHFGFTIYKADGSVAVTSDPQAAPTDRLELLVGPQCPHDRCQKRPGRLTDAQ